MDSLTIVVASVSLVSTCGKLGGYISWLTNKVENVNALKAFRSEIDSLSRVFGSISACFDNPSQATLVLAPQTGYETEHWRNVERSMEDCKKLLDKLHGILQSLSNAKREQDSVRKKLKASTLQRDVGELRLLKRQITAYRMAMELSLQLIVVSSILDDKPVNTSFPTNLDQITLDMQQLLNLLREQASSEPYMANLEECVLSAGKVLSAAASIVRYRSRMGRNPKEPKEQGDTTVTGLFPRVTFYTNQSHTAPEYDIEMRSNPYEKLKNTVLPKTPSSQSSAKSLSTSDSTIDDVSTPRIAKRDSDQSDHDSGNLDSMKDTIQQLLKSGAASLAAKDYGKAELLLNRVLKQSISTLGTQFAWRDETTRMLVEVYSKMSRWAEADNVLNHQYDGRDKILEVLATKFLQERRWNDVEHIVRHQFQGRENIMEKASRAYVIDKRWSDAKPLLAELLKYKAEESVKGLERMYILAEVCWAKWDLDEARNWCLRALEGPKTCLQKFHPLFSQFLKLLVQICEAKGDMVEKERYMVQLSVEVNECAEIEKLSLMNAKDASAQFESLLKDLPLGNNKQRNSIRDNIRKSGKGIVGSGHGWALIHSLASNDRQLALQLLLDKEADIEAIDEEGNTPLICATLNGHKSIVRILLKRGADHGVKNKLGNTALMSAVMTGRDNIVKVLLDGGADIESKDKDGNSVLMSAVMDGMTTIVELLVDRRAYIESKNNVGRTALMVAVLIGDEDMVRLLLEKGANIEAKDDQGNTPLMMASNKENVKLVELLLRRGADIDAKNNRGFTALSLAKRSGVYRTQVVRRLINSKVHNDVNPQKRATSPSVDVPTHVSKLSVK